MAGKKRKGIREILARAMYNLTMSNPMKKDERKKEKAARAEDAKLFKPPDNWLPLAPKELWRPKGHPNNDPLAFTTFRGGKRQPIEDATALQNKWWNEVHTDAPVVPFKRKSTELNWQNFTFDMLGPEDTDDAERLKYWFNKWAKPTGENGYGSHTRDKRVFMNILAENGISNKDFDWTLFRERYFHLYKDQYPLFKENQEKRKAEKAAKKKAEGKDK